ncbi:hypothetical protein LZP69_09450 [Shewanella sp. AS1]|uniref:hypothetical protein n=1 Tax=Shewanella sp. AS1 TaxID=2907626 RepID=UPI001F2E041D|nr:hypothetical protein [Shewanella sp. AS1]MCE9679396.1 hypothetical protein [Shewanella sp. AS1]
MKKLLISALVLGALTGCNADDVQDYVTDKVGVDIKNTNDVVTAADATTLSLEVIAQAAIDCGNDDNCDVDINYANGGVKGTLKVVDNNGVLTVTSDGLLNVWSNTNNLKAEVRLFASGNKVVLTPVAGTATYNVELQDAHIVVDQKGDDVIFDTRTLTPFVFDNNVAALQGFTGEAEIQGEDGDVRTFTYNGPGGDVNLSPLN